jgi:hypothetical protein
MVAIVQVNLLAAEKDIAEKKLADLSQEHLRLSLGIPSLVTRCK